MSSAPPSTAAAQATLDAVSTAALAGDRDAFDSQFSFIDATFRATVTRLFDNLTSIPLSTLSFRLHGNHEQLTAERQRVLGSTAWAQQAAVIWRLDADAQPAEQLIWFTFVRGSESTKIVGTNDGDTVTTGTPLWWVGSVHAAQIGRATAIVARDRPADVWAKRADAAALAVDERLQGKFGRDWSGRLVVEVPGNESTFEKVLGVQPGSYAELAAVTWPDGPNPGRAALRIVVNPVVADRLDEQALDVLLTHEATHVATRSAVSPAPLWLVEGFADYVAYDAHPSGAKAASAALLDQVRVAGPPQALPGDRLFSPGATKLELTYAQSWLACRFLADTFSARKLSRFYLEVDSGDASVKQALSSVFGLDPSQFVRGWDRYLLAAAARS